MSEEQKKTKPRKKRKSFLWLFLIPAKLVGVPLVLAILFVISIKAATDYSNLLWNDMVRPQLRNQAQQVVEYLTPPMQKAELVSVYCEAPSQGTQEMIRQGWTNREIEEILFDVEICG